jgi:hypothetical protein
LSSDLLYLADVSIAEDHDYAGIDIQVVHRIATSIGSGCRLVVIPYASRAELAYWSAIGFVPGTPGASEGLMHWQAAVSEHGAADRKRGKKIRATKPRGEKVARRH